MKKILFAVFALTLLVNCNNAKNLELEPETTEIIPKAIVTSDWSKYGRSAPVAIENVVLVGNKMSISVKYNGGCKKHDFQLIGFKMISKSIPPQRSLKVFHNANGDDCREVIEEIIHFDIRDLAVGENETVLKIEKYDKPISYIPTR